MGKNRKNINAIIPHEKDFFCIFFTLLF